MAAHPPSSLDFALRFAGGKGYLGLRERAPMELVGVERLELEIPDLRFPFDVSGGAVRFQTRRCLLKSAELRIDEARLQEWLSARPQLERYGLSHVRARLTGGRIELDGWARIGEREAAVTARVLLATGGATSDDRQRLRAFVTDVRIYGYLGAPAPLVGLGLALAVGALPIGRGQSPLHLYGLDLVETNPIEQVLWRALPPSGWRLPSYRETPLLEARVDAGQLVLRYGSSGAPEDEGRGERADAAPPSEPPDVEALEALHAATVDGDRRMQAGDLLGALEAYAEKAREAGRPELYERELAACAAMPSRLDDASMLAERLVERFPDRPFPLLTLAALEAERGASEAAGEKFLRLAERADAAGERADAAWASLAAGECFARVGRADATRLIERALAERPDHERAAALYAERLAAEGRWRDLLQLERRRLATAQKTARAEAQARVRLGRLWLERLGEPARAVPELEQAVKLDEKSAEAHRLLARALDVAGEPARALEAIDRAASLSAAADPALGAEVHLEAAQLAERHGAHGAAPDAPPEAAIVAALGHVRRALALSPAHAEALGRLASLLERAGRLDEAVESYERAIQQTPDPAARAPLLSELARIARDALQDPAAARVYVERSLKLRPTPEALRLAAGLAESDGRGEDLAELLAALAAGGDREAGLKRARVLYGLGRFVEAAESADALAAFRPAEALPIVVAAREALGQTELQRAALERLIAARPDATARVRLAQLLADDGDLDGARSLLMAALGAEPDGARDVLEALCDVLLRQGDDAALDVALGRLAAARETGRDRARALAAQGAARARLGLTAEAAESYRAALALEPEDAQTRAGLAEAAWALRLWDEARAALEPLHQRGLPPRVERALRLGDIAERQSQPAAAIGFYQAALEAGATGGDAVRAWNALTGLYHARGDHEAEARALLAAADDERTGEAEVGRAGRLVSAADLLRKRGGRLDEAQAIYERALTLDPLQLAALDALEAMVEGDAALTAQVLGRKVAATARRPAQQKAILGRLAQLQAEKLGRPDAAREAYRRALELDPDFRAALTFLADDARARGDAAEEQARLEKLAALPADAADVEARAAELLRLAQLYIHANRPSEAEALARRTLDAFPRHPAALELLDDLYTKTGRTDELAGVLGERAALSGGSPALELLHRRAALLDGAGKRREAIGAYQELVTLHPAHAASWNRLAALLRLEEDWEPLAAVLTRLAERQFADGRVPEAEALHVEVSHLYHDRLRDRVRAQEALERALEVEPRSRVALGGLLALARARGDLASALGADDPRAPLSDPDVLLGRLAEAEDRPQARAQVIGERARARQARGDLEGALALVRDLDVETAPDSVLRLRVDLEEAQAARPNLAEAAGGATTSTAAPALEALRARSSASADLATERWAVRKLARLAAESGPSPAAEELLRRAVELDPDDRDATRALALIERTRGDDRAYLESLERLLKAARRNFEGAEREAEIGIEMAEVLRRTGDLDGARARLQEAIGAAPKNGRAWRLRGAVDHARGSAPEATEALEHAAELGALDPQGFAELGALYLEAGEAQRAAAAFARAGDSAPPRLRAEALEGAGRDADALAAWRGLDDPEARARVARLERRRAERAFAAGRASEARVSAVEALVGDPADEQALGWAIHGLSPAAMLALLDELAQRIAAGPAAALYRRVAARLDGDDARAALERAVALSPDAGALVALGDRERGPQAARRYQQALELDPSSHEAALALEREAVPADAARILAAARERCHDPRARARLSALLGALHRDRLDDAAQARENFRRALSDSTLGDELRAETLRSLAALERADGQAAEALLETLHQEGTARDTDLRHLAERYVERGAFAAAIPLLDGLPGSTDLLVRCLEATNRYDDLVDLYEREAPRKMPAEARACYVRAAALCAGPLADPRRAAALLERALPLGPADAELWARLGHLYSGPLGNPEEGARCFALAYAADRARTDVLLPLGNFHDARGEWEPAGDYYRQALERDAVPAAEVQRVRLRLAESARARGDVAGEIAALRSALAGGADPALWRRLADLHRTSGDGRALAEALQQLALEARGAERAALLREAVAHVGPDESAALYEQIAEDDPDDEAARDRVLERLRTGRDREALMSRLEREVARAAQPQTGDPAPRSQRRAALSLELARLAIESGDAGRALVGYRAALASAPGLEPARGLHQLLAESGRESEAAAELETALFDARLDPAARGELVQLATRAHLASGADAGAALAFLDRARAAGLDPEVEPTAWRALLRSELRFPELVAALDRAATAEGDAERRLELELEAADVLQRELAQPADAARRLSTLLSAHPERRDLAERARQLYAAASEPRKALEILEHELRLAPIDDQPQLRIARGELLLEAGHEAEAEAEFLHALITTRRVGRAHAALAAVLKRRGDLAGALEHLIAAADAPDLEPARAAACAVDAADVLLREGDTTTAERLYQLAAALDAADRRSVEGLAHLAAARGQYERQAELLGRAALLTPDRRERARIALERARLYRVELGRDLDAYRCYKEAVACDPTLREAASGLREMAETRGEWALAAEQLYREIAVTPEDVQRAALHEQLGRLLENKLLDPAEALRNFEQAAATLVQAQAGRNAPWADLVRLYTDANKLREAAAAADRLAESSEDAGRRAEALGRAGELYERLGDAESARVRLAKAAAIGGEAGRKADDSLLRLADEAGDPEELKRRIEERLAIEPEGELRLEFLRRLLSLAVHDGDPQEIDQRAQEILARAPADPLAFVERKRVLEKRGDEAGVAQLLRARAAAVDDPVESAARRFEAGRIAEKLLDVPGAFADYEAALAVDAAHVPALDALADLAYRQGQVPRARALYGALGARPSALAPDEVLRRRAELAEEAGASEEALRFFQAAASQNPSNLAAHEALARLALVRQDAAGAFSSLRAVLELLPLDAVDRITELRRQLGKLALKLGDREQARHYFELVLAQDPTRSDALDALAQLYVEAEDWEAAAHAYSRLSYLADKPAERAELLYRRGEILRTKLGDLERANDAFLKAADLHPTHAPTLRRLVVYYYDEGDHAAVAEVARELEALPAPLEDAAVEAGLGIALGGDEARGTVVVAVAQPPGPRLVSALARAKIAELAKLDPALRAAARALGGGDSGRALLIEALRDWIRERPADLGARAALGRLYDAGGDPVRARLQYSVPAFVDWTGSAARRLRELPAPEPLGIPDDHLVHPRARGTLRDALTALGPIVLGLSPAQVDADPAPAWAEKLRPLARAAGLDDIDAAVVVDLLDPAWVEPTHPPRVLLQRRVLADEAAARFATVRALHALRAGLPLVEGRSPDDVAAMVRAAASMFLPDLSASARAGAFVKAWEAELRALDLRPEVLEESVRTHLEVVLVACVLDTAALASGAAYCAAERSTADRVALSATGDLRAGLIALCPPEATTPETRAAALGDSPALAELLAFTALLA